MGTATLVTLCLTLLLSLRDYSVTAAPQQMEPMEAPGPAFGGEALSGEMMAAERVMGVDEGNDAFHDMEAAVKSAGERVAGVNLELESALKAAESAPVKY